ncbi:unnamed protein product [Arabis nemorensis]|uniref:Uncharacterized protein n=1 Tax=Arabis nemorensis TaxID=586526 RepID=A0A565BNC0_9BRAS|nr:unnamed protein product [Arabis nemorensis]
MAKKGGATLVEDAPWRVSSVKPVPRISRSPILSISQSSETDYAISVMKHPNPVGGGLAMEAVLESAGPECVVPGQVTPLRLLGVKVWPVEVDLKFLEPVGKELKMLGKCNSWYINIIDGHLLLVSGFPRIMSKLMTGINKWHIVGVKP